MLKKLLLGSLLMTVFGCVSLTSAQNTERAPKLPNNLASFENKYPMDLFKNAAMKKRLRALLGKSYDGFMEAIGRTGTDGEKRRSAHRQRLCERALRDLRSDRRRRRFGENDSLRHRRRRAQSEIPKIQRIVAKFSGGHYRLGE